MCIIPACIKYFKYNKKYFYIYLLGLAGVVLLHADQGRAALALGIQAADDVAGKITDERFSMMSQSYEDEQTQLKAEIQTLQQDIEVQERQIENLEQFIQRVHLSLIHI